MKWVVFDAVGTLMYPCPGVPLAYHEIGRRYGSRLSEKVVRERLAVAFGSVVRPRGDRTSADDEQAWWRRVVAATLTDVSDPAAPLMTGLVSAGTVEYFLSVLGAPVVPVLGGLRVMDPDTLVVIETSSHCLLMVNRFSPDPVSVRFAVSSGRACPHNAAAVHCVQQV